MPIVSLTAKLPSDVGKCEYLEESVQFHRTKVEHKLLRICSRNKNVRERHKRKWPSIQKVIDRGILYICCPPWKIISIQLSIEF